MAKAKLNYDFLKEYLAENILEEDYALITHYIQLQGSGNEKKYQSVLETRNIDLLKLPSSEVFNTKHNIPFTAKSGKFTFIDLFAGIGGFRLAMQNCGGVCVFSSEWDVAAKQTYFENYGEVPFGDITKSEIKDMIPDHFDVLCAGFPCQAFSIAGYQKGFEDVRGTLFFDIAEIIERYRPKAFYLENVKNLQSHDKGKTFEKIMDVLKKRLNYKVDYKVMNPSEYANVPQNRERIFIVGFDPKQVDVSKYLVDDINEDDGKKFIFPFPHKIDLISTIHDIINAEESDGRLFYKPGHLYYERMVPVITNPETIYQWRRVYIRENKNNVCPTLTANMGEGGHNVPLVFIPNKGIRKLSPEECLGFQGFPVKQGFRYPTTIAQSKKYKQAGNSVTEPLIERVAKELISMVGVGE